MTLLAITGVGALLPGAASPAALLALLDERRRAFAALADDEAPGSRSRWAARLGPVDADGSLPPRRARRLDPASLAALLAARQALDGAKLAGADWIGRELAVVLATVSAGSGPLERFLTRLLGSGPAAASPFEFPNTVPNAPAGHLSIELGLAGPNATLAQKQAGIVPALLTARLWLDDGRCRAALAGCADEWSPLHQLGYDRLGALRRDPDPTGGAGLLLGDGACVLALEGDGGARRRAAPVLARVAGLAAGSAAAEPHRWVADPAPLVAAARAALAEAGLATADVGSLVLAANGALAAEQAEAAALEQLFAGRRLAATGIKGAIGESATAGAASLATAALARARRRLPPFAGGRLAAWPPAVRLLEAPEPLPRGATLALLAAAGGACGAVVLV